MLVRDPRATFISRLAAEGQMGLIGDEGGDIGRPYLDAMRTECEQTYASYQGEINK